MKPPIIADNHGDVLVFESVAKAELYMEPIDIRNREYVIYDSEGRLLTASIIKTEKGRERVVVKVEEPHRHDREALRTILAQFLSKVSDAKQSFQSRSLEQLVEASLRFKTE